VEKAMKFVRISSLVVGLLAVIGVNASPALADGESLENQPALARAAASFLLYQDDIDSVNGRPIQTPNDVREILQQIGGHNTRSLTAGFVAYGALIAARDPEFATAIREIAASWGRERIVMDLPSDPSYAASLAGADRAIAAAQNDIRQSIQRAQSIGEKMIAQSYSLQKVAWGTQRALDKDAQIAALSQRSAAPRPTPADIVARLLAPNSSDGLASFPTASPSSAIQRVAFQTKASRQNTANALLTAAAYFVLEPNARTLPPGYQAVIEDDQTRRCVEFARLNLHQCVRAAHYVTDIPFCIGKYLNSDGSNGSAPACFATTE